VALNITGTRATAGSYLTAWPGDQPRPLTTNVTITPGQDRNDAAIVKLAPDGTISIYNNTGSTDVFVDLQGYYTQPVPTATYTYDGTGLRASKTVRLAQIEVESVAYVVCVPGGRR
jgi:hypothetical protein